MFTNLQALSIPEGNVVKIESGSVVLWEKVTGGLPNTYQQVEYIQTNGNQAIDTGIMASDYTDGLEYVFEGNCTGISNQNNYLFGCLNSSKRSGNPTWTDGVMMILIGGNDKAYFRKSVSTNVDFVLKVRGTSSDIANMTATYNDESLNLIGSYANCTMPSSNIYLLACNINGMYYSSISAPFTGKLYSFIMLDMNGNEIRHFIPCYRKADGVIGFYDTVGGSFYTNIGTGSFTKGENV